MGVWPHLQRQLRAQAAGEAAASNLIRRALPLRAAGAYAAGCNSCLAWPCLSLLSPLPPHPYNALGVPDDLQPFKAARPGQSRVQLTGSGAGQVGTGSRVKQASTQMMSGRATPEGPCRPCQCAHMHGAACAHGRHPAIYTWPAPEGPLKSESRSMTTCSRSHDVQSVAGPPLQQCQCTHPLLPRKHEYAAAPPMCHWLPCRQRSAADQHHAFASMPGSLGWGRRYMISMAHSGARPQPRGYMSL